jgi:ATPase subunit of ABC transporter with duplicated ATPase domains
VLTAKDVRVHRGNQVVLDRVSLSVAPRARLGIVGPNGVGKSTLLLVLAGGLRPEAGTVERSPASLRVGYLAQEMDARSGEPVLGYLARRTGVKAAAAELDRLTAALADDPAAVGDYSDALERFLALGGDDFEARAAAVAAELGLPADQLSAPVGELSGGQAARTGLAAVLLARFDVFLLDEPTNDLDFAGLDRLEGFVQRVNAAVVVVSHDRAFLDRVVDRTVELDEHHRTATEYAGGWSEYVERRALARSQQAQAYAEWTAQRERLRQRIRTQRSWSETGVRKAVRRPRDHDKAQRGFFANRTEKQAAKVRHSERAIDRLGMVEKPWEGWNLQLDLAPNARSGDIVARMEQAVVARGRFTLGPLDVEVAWADRIAITGPNGGGKSTLLAAMLGQLPLRSGRRWLGPGVVVGQLDQRRTLLDTGDHLLEGFGAATGLFPEASRTLLAKFGLGPDHVYRRAADLSPGERTRALLAVLMAAGTNCLVLDEPTNHLDLPAIEQLEAALAGYQGTLLVVSHDRWLLETLTVNRTWAVDAGALIDTSV